MTSNPENKTGAPQTQSNAQPANERPSDPWSALRRFTPARIGLGRTGVSAKTKDVLDFGWAHAMAQDAIHRPFDTQGMTERLKARNWPVLSVSSQARDRATFLMRPDLGRRLNEAGVATLEGAAKAAPTPDIAFVIADGLSSLAIERYAADLLDHTRPLLTGRRAIAPIIIATQARVALGDEIATLLGARLVVVLIGERPGLSSADSLGTYLTYAPEIGTMDAARNCLSNIRAEGLPIPAAAAKLAWFIDQALARQLSGIALKDESGGNALENQGPKTKGD